MNTTNKYYNIIINTDEFKDMYIEKYTNYEYAQILNIGQSIFKIIKKLYNKDLLKNIKKNHIDELLKLLLYNLLGDISDIDIVVLNIMMINTWYESKYDIFYD
jgi:hypothetical protein